MRACGLLACGVLAACGAPIAMAMTETCVADLEAYEKSVPLTGYSAWGGDQLDPVLANVGLDRSRVRGVTCVRDALELGPHDWMVPQSGLGLTLRSGEGPAHVVMRMRKGEMTAVVVDGALPPESAARMALALNGYAKHAPPAQASEPVTPPDPASDPRMRESSEEEFCAAVACQKDVTIRLRQEDGTLFERTYSSLPLEFREGSPVVLPGQKLQFEATPDGGRLRLRRLDGPGDPQRTLQVALTQMDDGGMLLYLENPFDRRVKFSLALMRLDAEHLERTSSCPVIAGGFLQEVWPYPIFQIVLLDARLLGEDEDVGCVD